MSGKDNRLLRSSISNNPQLKNKLADPKIYIDPKKLEQEQKQFTKSSKTQRSPPSTTQTFFSENFPSPSAETSKLGPSIKTNITSETENEQLQNIELLDEAAGSSQPKPQSSNTFTDEKNKFSTILKQTQNIRQRSRSVSDSCDIAANKTLQDQSLQSSLFLSDCSSDENLENKTKSEFDNTLLNPNNYTDIEGFGDQRLFNYNLETDTALLRNTFDISAQKGTPSAPKIPSPISVRKNLLHIPIHKDTNNIATTNPNLISFSPNLNNPDSNNQNNPITVNEPINQFVAMNAEQLAEQARLQQQQALEQNQQLVRLPANPRGAEPKRSPPHVIAAFIPHWDGKNIDVREIIKKIKRLRGYFAAIDEPFVVRHIIERFSGELYTNLCDDTIETIDQLIAAITDNIPINKTCSEARAELEHMVQKPEEKVITFHHRLQNQAQQVLDLYTEEENPDEPTRATFKTLVETCKLKQFKFGLSKDIKSVMVFNDQLTYEQLVTLAKAIEKQFTKITELQKSSKLNESDLEDKPVTATINSFRCTSCQICQGPGHEAFTCDQAACAYCKQSDHFTKDCTIAKNKLIFSCKLCSNPGHTIDKCNLKSKNSSYCQYCQTLGHNVMNCEHINHFVVCFKCKETGHDAFTCKKLITENKQTSPCENCNETGHESKNCPNNTCQKCNNVGHTAKFCTLNKRSYCYFCYEDDHVTTDCEAYKIFSITIRGPAVAPTPNKNIVCHKCQGKGHIARFCRSQKPQLALQPFQPQQNLVPIQNTCVCQYCGGKGHTVHSCYKLANFMKQSQNLVPSITSNNTFPAQSNFLTNRPPIICAHCKKRGHTVQNCWSNPANYPQNVTQNTQQNVAPTQKIPDINNICQLCKKPGHEVQNCPKFLQIQLQTAQICNYCKEPGHLIQDCPKRAAKMQGNA